MARNTKRSSVFPAKRSLAEPLEPRLLFSASADITLLNDNTDDLSSLQLAAQQTDLTAIYYASNTEQPEPIFAYHSDTSQPSQPTQLLVVDRSIEDYDTLVDDFLTDQNRDDYTLVYLNADEDGVQQLTAAIQNHTNINAIHVLSHANDGELTLGSTELSSQNLNQYQSAIESWQDYLSDDADLLFYGCDFGASAQGLNLIEQLATLSGADIAASNDTSGHSNDWDLEIRNGQIETEQLQAHSTEWQGILGVTNYIDTGTVTNNAFITEFQSVGQTFLYDSGNGFYSVDQIGLQIRQDPSASTQTITVQLLNAWEGTVLGSATMSSDDLGTSYSLQTFSFDGVALEDNVLYYIKVLSDGNDGLISVGYDNTAPFADGQYVLNSGVLEGSRDLVFQVGDDDTTNTAPVVDNMIADQSEFAGTDFTYTFPADTFLDLDGDTLTYSALSSGGALPGWLSFDSATRTFTGSPDYGDNGNFSIEVIANDGNGGTVSDFFSFTIQPNSAPTGSVTISGTAEEDSTLTANNTLADSDGLGVISYQWQRDGADISGATSSTYTLGQDDVGSTITALASYTDGNGANESVSSAGTAAVSNVNDNPTGSVSISGTAQEDQTLTASNTLADEDGLGAITYQWQRGGVNIAGATNSTYTLTQDDVGAVITVVASYTDGEGTAESESSAGTAAVTNVNDNPTGSVSISGTAQEDQTLTASNNLADEDGLGAITYQWQRGGVDIAGATNSTYTLTQDDVGEVITVVASYTDGEGTAESETSPGTAAVTNVNDNPTGSVSISGTAQEDQTLTASNNLADEDGLGAITYQWQRGGVDIAGATNSTYTLTQDDVGAVITVVASYTDGEGTAESESSAATAAVTNVNDNPTGSVSISGTAQEDQTLTASNNLADEDGLGAITYQWQRGGVDIAGATNSTYTLTQSDVGEVITVVASYTDGEGTAESETSPGTAAVTNVNDDPTGSVSISGTAQEDQTLTASNTLADEDGLGAITYQWQRGGVDIAGATNATYTLTQSDVGEVITVVASYTDGEGTAESETSAGTAAVTNVNDNPTGSVSIGGTAQEDQTLTASNTLADEDGLGAITYQWQRGGVNIAGATNSTYTLTQSDVGEVITVVASYTDGEGTAESETSAGTAAVTNVNDNPTGSVSISGTAQEDQTLTASNTLADEDGLGAITYQWQRGGVDIAGATNSTYTLTQDDVGEVITVVASYTDGEGTAESETSAGTAAVTNVNDDPTGSVTITGTAREDQILTANNTLADEDGLGAITYQWQRGGVDIAGATNSTYTLTQSDVGEVITVVASYTDSEGTAESETSAATAAVINVNDDPTGTVSISGTAQEDQTLTASNTLVDEDGVGAITYQWQRDGVDIAGATNSTYTLTQTDVGTVITVVANYTDGEGTPESETSAGTGAVTNVNDDPTGSVTITGTAQEDQTLTAANTLADEDGLGAITYQWQRDGVDIAGATSTTYTLGQDDVGAAITVVASYTDGEGSAESETSAATAAVTNVNDAPSGGVLISGTAQEEETLTASNTLADEDGLGAITYQWQRDGVDIGGATNTTYTLTNADVGSVITVVASYTDDEGTAESVTSSDTSSVTPKANSVPTGNVSITGTAAEDETLTASNTLADADGLGAITYQWQRDGVDIVGATNSTYTLTQSDVDSTIRVIASYTDGGGNNESVTSASTGAVSNVNDSPTGSVTISGTAQEDETLTANNSLADEDGLGAITYQWQRGGVDIAGATASTYTLTQDDVGETITVVASYTDGQGTAESVSSSATAPITNVNDAPTGTVVISGTAREDQTLTASNNLADEDGLGAITYQWQRGGVDIAGANASTYTLTQDDVGAAITVVASYTDAEGTNESASSPSTASVVNVNDDPAGSVSISGSTQEDQTLTASNTITDEDGLGAISYQWQRDGVDIVGATNSTYTLGQNDVGAVITVIASYTDTQGTNESVTSAGTAAISNVNDVPTGSVSISGTAEEDQTLTASNTLADDDGLGAITYQWQRDGVDIAGATNSTYTLTQTDVGAVITVVASYTDGEGTTENESSAGTAVVANINDSPAGSVTISGTAEEDETLTANNTLADEDGLGVITYQWQRDGVDIAGATNSTYTLTQSDVGTVITVIASYTDGEGTAESATSAGTAAVTNVNDAPTGSVTISGTTQEDQTLTASNTLADEDGLGAITYQWQRDGVDIAGANNSTYTLTADDVGSAITAVATYTDGQGNPESESSVATPPVSSAANSLPSGNVSISGTAQETQTLTASNTLADADGMGVVSYQWQRNGTNISGATNSTYTLTQNDVGATITVVASYTDGGGNPESQTSSPTASVANVNDAPTGSVTISLADQPGSSVNDTLLEGQTLIASNTLSDNDGLGTINYQWQRDGDNIEGANNTTYTLTQADVGQAITVVATYTDGQGTEENQTSNPTAIVDNVNDSPTGSVVITGANQAGNILTASNTLSDEDGLGAINYQWLRDGEVIEGATDTSYSLTEDDIGTVVSVIAQYTDQQGFEEQITSNSIGPILADIPDNTAPQVPANIAIEVNEDSNPSNLNLWELVADNETTSSELNFTVIDNSNPELVTTTLLNDSGELNLAYVANANGDATILLRVADPDGLSSDFTVTVNVLPVNDSPQSSNNLTAELLATNSGGELILANAFSDIEEGENLNVQIMNSDTAERINVNTIRLDNGQLIIDYNWARVGVENLTIRAVDSEGAWVETQLQITVSAIAVEPPITPPTDGGVIPETPTTPPTPDIDDSNSGGDNEDSDNGSNDSDEDNDENSDDVAPSGDPIFTGLDPILADTSANNNDTSANIEAIYGAFSVEDLALATEEQRILYQQIRGETDNDSGLMAELLNLEDNYISNIQTEEFKQELERFREDMAQSIEEQQQGQLMMTGAALSLSTGILIWALRASSLLLTLFSMLPLWKGLDPMPVLTSVNERKAALEKMKKDQAKEDVDAKEVGHLFDKSSGTG